MKVVPSGKPEHTTTTHFWISAPLVVLGLGLVTAAAVFFIRKCSINKKDQEEKEPQVIGHERFYQGRSSRSNSKRKRRAPRRAHSAAEFSPVVLTAAHRRAAFQNRSHSSENKSGEGDSTVPSQRIESFVKIFLTRRSSAIPKHEYSALKTDSDNKERAESQIRNGAFVVCKNRLANSERYEFKSQLGDLGSRSDKHWFTVHDTNLKADRLLSFVTIPSGCLINPSLTTRATLLELFRGLHHPYIHPVLDIEFWDSLAVFISPLNPSGSLRDLIHGSIWHEDYDRKYQSRGGGLPLRTIQCLGKQILEGLLFLRNRYFPPFYHLHSGNVIIQNGVARLAGLENSLIGLQPRLPAAPETLAFGHILFEMAAGYELTTPPSPAHLQLELERAPKVADALSLIFHNRIPQLEELVYCELFRGVELRELRGASITQMRSVPDVLDLLEIVRNPPSPIRRKDVVVIIERRQLEDILEEDNEEFSASEKNDDTR